MSEATKMTHYEQAMAFSSQFRREDRTDVLHGYLSGVEVSRVSNSEDMLDTIRETQIVTLHDFNPVTAAVAGSDAFIVGASFGAMAAKRESS